MKIIGSGVLACFGSYTSVNSFTPSRIGTRDSVRSKRSSGWGWAKARGDATRRKARAKPVRMEDSVDPCKSYELVTNYTDASVAVEDKVYASSTLTPARDESRN